MGSCEAMTTSEYRNLSVWDFHNPVRIYFGAGQIDRLAEIVGKKRTLILTTPGFTRRGLTARLMELLGSSVAELVDTVKSLPELDDLERLGHRLRDKRIDLIVAVGGGSVIDTAKVVSVLIGKESSDQFSLRRHFSNGSHELHGTAVPVVAVPTTAGTGSEVTPFATVWDMNSKEKFSLSGPRLFPQVAILDPNLTLSLTRDTTVHTGLDAVSQALEAIWNRNANPITTLLATDALRLGLTTLPQLAGNLESLELRTAMMQASLFAGLAISRTRTALAHSISYPLTAYFGMPHGLACGFALPAILRKNCEADGGRFEHLAKSLGLQSVPELYQTLTKFLQDLRVPEMVNQYLRETGMSYMIAELAPQMLSSERSRNNLVTLTVDQIRDILEEALSSMNIR